MAIELEKNKPLISLKWDPKIPTLPKTKTKNDGKKITENSNIELIDGLFVPPNDPKKVNKFLKKQIKDTAGKSWFDMAAPTITPELKKDLQLIKLRGVMDPKRHYKKGGKSLPKYFQVGTVVEAPSDYFSGRLTKKERKTSLADELLADQALNRYRKRKVNEIEDERRPGGVDKWKHKGKQSFKRSKQRRH